MYNKSLDIFLAVADCGSFTKASKQLFISHTAVMKQMNSLEDHIGVPLFQRSNHGIFLTDAGQCLYKKAKEIKLFSQKTIEEVKKAHYASQITIRVGTSLFYPCHVFMDLWDSISHDYPQYQLQIVPILDDENRFDELNKSYDFLVGPYNSEIGGSNFPFIPIGSYKFCISIPKKHPLSKKKSLSFEDLSGEHLMIMEHGYSAVNDQIRLELENNYPSVILDDIAPHYSIHTFNHCIEKNELLLSLECWNDVHPALVSVPLCEPYTIPYGILTDKKISPELERFFECIQQLLI